MLRGALAFFVLGLVAVVLGANNIAGLSIEIGKTLLFVFLALAVISAIIGLVTGRGSRGSVLSVLVAIGLASAGVAGVFTTHMASAEETNGEKVENKMDEAKKDSKKGVRKAKRHVRNATGNGSVTSDAKDAANDAGDEINHGAKKIKNKVD